MNSDIGGAPKRHDTIKLIIFLNRVSITDQRMNTIETKSVCTVTEFCVISSSKDWLVT